MRQPRTEGGGSITPSQWHLIGWRGQYPGSGAAKILGCKRRIYTLGDRALSALPQVFVHDWSAEMSYLDAHPPLEIAMMPSPSYCLTAVSCVHIRGLRYDSSSEKDADYEY